MSTDASSFDMPRPDRVNTPAEFMAAMRALRAWAKLTYRQIEDRALQAGDKLPHSTIATALSRNRIPRESTIASFVRACGGDRKDVEAWLAARKRINSEDKADTNLAYAVEAWLVSRSKLTTQEIRTLSTEEIDTQSVELTTSYSAGTLARAVAESKGERWVGLHRRREPRRFSLRRVREN
ncbi:MAG TPA: hypothetical protein VFC19_07115 [Candidatus Limnocylindrales bacterium]|nr:hypothetical protein [Candidatus Limnocylindrales bacterium]